MAHLLQRFEERLAENSDRAAIIFFARGRDCSVSYAQLDKKVRRCAATYAAAGLKSGDRVLLLVPVSVELYAALLGLFRIGAVAVLVDPSAGRANFIAACERARPVAFVGPPLAHLWAMSMRPLRRVRARFVVSGWIPGARQLFSYPAASGPAQSCAESHPALLTFTSGSTGVPKGIERTHGFLLRQHEVLAESIELRAGMVDLMTLPVFGLANLASGVSSIIPNARLSRPGFIDPKPVLAQIVRLRPDRISAAPAFVERLLDGLSSPSELQSFRRIYTGGGPVTLNLLRRLREVCPQARIVAVYGSTEAEPIAEVSTEELREHEEEPVPLGLPAGHPNPHVRCVILRPDLKQFPTSLTEEAFARLCLPPGEKGEIAVSGAHVVERYLDGVGESETKLRVLAGEDGRSRVWHRTGDAGRMDPQGFLWLLGRVSAGVANDAGDHVYPLEVDSKLLAIPEIRHTALLSIAGAAAVAIELKGARQISDSLRTRIQAELATLGLAKASLYLVSRIPMDKRHNSKVDYPKLKMQLARLSGTDAG